MRRERGSATVWAVLVVCVLCTVFGGVLALGQVVVARHRAAGAADLAALAAAASWTRGEQAACATAQRVARAQGADLSRCAAAGEVAEVTAGVRLGPFTARVPSRAGPQEALGATEPYPPGPAGEVRAQPGTPRPPGA